MQSSAAEVPRAAATRDFMPTFIHRRTPHAKVAARCCVQRRHAAQQHQPAMPQKWRQTAPRRATPPRQRARCASRARVALSPARHVVNAFKRSRDALPARTRGSRVNAFDKMAVRSAKQTRGNSSGAAARRNDNASRVVVCAVPFDTAEMLAVRDRQATPLRVAQRQ